MTNFLELQPRMKSSFKDNFPQNFANFPLKTNIFLLEPDGHSRPVICVQIRNKNLLNYKVIQDNLLLYFKIFFQQSYFSLGGYVEISSISPFDEKDVLPEFMYDPLSEEDNILLSGLGEVEHPEHATFFNGFPKLVNWLDDETQEKHPEFCCIRSGLSHIKLDADKAYRKLNQHYPNEFSFEGNILRRIKENAVIINEKLPKLMKLIQEEFVKKQELKHPH